MGSADSCTSFPSKYGFLSFRPPLRPSFRPRFRPLFKVVSGFATVISKTRPPKTVISECLVLIHLQPSDTGVSTGVANALLRFEAVAKNSFGFQPPFRPPFRLGSCSSLLFLPLRPLPLLPPILSLLCSFAPLPSLLPSSSLSLLDWGLVACWGARAQIAQRSQIPFSPLQHVEKQIHHVIGR